MKLKQILLEQDEKQSQDYWQQSRDKSFKTQRTKFNPETGQISWDVEFTPLSALRDTITQATEYFKDTLRKYPEDYRLNHLYSKFMGFKKAFSTYMNQKYNK